MPFKFKNIIARVTTGNERSVKVKKNFVASLGIKGVSIAITFFLVPITLGYITEELYGIWLILSSLLMMIQYFDIGFTLGLKNKLTQAIAVKDFDKGKSLVSTTYIILIIIFLPLCFVLEIVTPFIPWSRFFNTPEIYNSQIVSALQIMFACVCLQMIANTLVSVLSAYQRTAMASFFPVLGNVISLIIIVLLSKYTEPSLVKLAFAISTMPVIVLSFASIYLYSSAYRDVSPSISFIRFGLVQELFGLGAKFFLIQIQMIVMYQATNILIANVSNPIEVANYNVAYRYINMAFMIFNILLTPIWPAFTDAYTKQDFVWMKSIYSKLVNVLFMTFGIIIVMVIVSPVFYRLWLGEKMSIPFIMTLSVAAYVMIHSWDSLQVMLINGIGTVKLQTYITLVGLFCNIPLALLLGRYFGAIGVIMSMTVINSFYSIIFTIQVRKLINKDAQGIWVQ